MFSKSCEYGIRAALYIAQHANGSKNIGLKEIAADQEIPEHFLSKVLQVLVKHKILKSTRGLRGGFSLNHDANKINILGIISAIDGMDLFNTCVLGLKDCSSDKPCPVHNKYKPIKEEFLRILTNKTLYDFVKELNGGSTFLTLKED
jgi:Rrf2 family protein